MTREEAMQEVNKAFEPAFANYIITALTEGATVSDRSEDVVSRQAVLEVLKNNRYRFNISQEGYCEGKVLWRENLIKDDACKEIEQLPSVTPKEKTGHWIPDVDRWGDIETTVNGYRCDKCNTFNTDKDNYCPNCGARMKVENDS